MSETVSDPDVAMLARLAELDLAAAERVHGKLMVAEDAAEVADLGRTYQRLARSLRQTLALKAKLARDAAAAERRRDAQAGDPEPAADRLSVTDICVEELQDAVGRIVHKVCGPDAERREALLERFDRELDDWAEEEDFIEVALDIQVLRACKLLDLPTALVRTWRDLPRPNEQVEDWMFDAPLRPAAGADSS